MNCPLCGQDKPLLILDEKGNSCPDCYLGQASARQAEITWQDPARTLLAQDQAGRQHSFLLSQITLDGQTRWLAEEKDGSSFAVQTRPKESQTQALARLFAKISAGLLLENLLVTNGEQDCLASRHYLAPVGSGRIAYLEKDNSCRLVLDGQMLAAEDFFTLLSTYSDHTLVFQIQDLAEDILEKDMALLFCRIDARSIQDHFSRCLSWFLDGSFLSYKREAALASALERPLAEFGLFCRYQPPAKALALGRLLIDYLLSFQTDAQNFPQAQIKQIRTLLADL